MTDMSLAQFAKESLASADLCTRQLYAGTMQVDVTFVEGMVATNLLDAMVLRPLMGIEIPIADLNQLANQVLPHANIQQPTSPDQALELLLCGWALVEVAGLQGGLAADLRSVDTRTVGESSENIIKGSKDGFVESLRTNTALLRSHMVSPRLRIVEQSVGQSIQSRVALCYHADRADPELVKYLTRRLAEYPKDGILSASDLEDHLGKHKFKVFPEFNYTERPDKVVANIAEGRVAIMVQNLPFVYIAPSNFSSLMQAVEDYSFNIVIATLIRLLRYAAFFLSLTLPALYISFMLFHQEMIPRELAVAIIISKQGVPLPTSAEIILMLIAFEILIEAGLRMPKAVGQAVSIVGAIIVGQAAVAASLLSPSVIVIGALTAIAGFAVPNQDVSNAIRFWRLLLAVLSIISGLFGMVLGLIVLGSLIARMQFFDDPYLYPFCSAGGDFLARDTFVRPIGGVQ